MDWPKRILLSLSENPDTSTSYELTFLDKVSGSIVVLLRRVDLEVLRRTIDDTLSAIDDSRW